MLSILVVVVVDAVPILVVVVVDAVGSFYFGSFAIGNEIVAVNEWVMSLLKQE